MVYYQGIILLELQEHGLHVYVQGSNADNNLSLQSALILLAFGICLNFLSQNLSQTSAEISAFEVLYIF